MGAVLRLATQPVTQADVECAWATYRAMQLAEVDDPALVNDAAHQRATVEAYNRYFRLFSDWCRQ